MKTLKLRETDEYITLGQLLKAEGLVGSGVEAKEVITRGMAKVNGEVENRRGRKLRDGDTAEYNGTEIRVVR